MEVRTFVELGICVLQHSHSLEDLICSVAVQVVVVGVLQFYQAEAVEVVDRLATLGTAYPSLLRPIERQLVMVHHCSAVAVVWADSSVVAQLSLHFGHFGPDAWPFAGS